MSMILETFDLETEIKSNFLDFGNTHEIVEKNLRSQFATSSLVEQKYGDRSCLPFAFPD